MLSRLLKRRLTCPVCTMSRRGFNPHGLIPRPNARCPNCGALERHRFLWLFLQRRTDLFGGTRKKVLHFAPERFFAERLAKLPHLDYTTADLYNPAMVKADITALPFPDASFDVLICSHVLEHIPDDRKAMRECRRVLRHDGYAVILVPITAPATVEDLTITDPKERERLYGQHDHVRRYGPDFADRLKEAGWSVAEHAADAVAGPERARFAIPHDEPPVYLCLKT